VALTVVLGPRRSGKSAAAERLASEPSAPVVYLAPLTVTDDELRVRVADHQARRPADWETIESADPLAALATIDPRATVLLDSLGTWVSEVLWRAGALEDPPPDPGAADVALAALIDAVTAFADAAAVRPGLTIVVAEEAGWGPVPPSPATRRWLDALGDAAQRCTARADRALLVVAGRALELP
jgi:adenosylcobinamide kinase/adenosylcobinamide-phosphate guanylyltransferase